MFTGKDTIYVKTYESLLQRKSESYTELYFAGYSLLPTSIPKNGAINFTFVVSNLEGKEFSYPYIVYFVTKSGQRYMLDSGAINLPKDQSGKVNVSYVFTNPNQSGRVVVELTNINQKINFLLPRNQ